MYSGGAALKFKKSKAVATKQVTITETSNVLVRARATQKGGSPKLTVRVDGVSKGTKRIDSSALADYSYNQAELQPGTHALGVKGGNIAAGRNLYFDLMRFPAVTPPPPDPGRIYFRTSRYGTNGAYEIASMKPDGTDVRRITHYLDTQLPRVTGGAFALSSDGSKMLYTREDALEIANADGSNPIQDWTYGAYHAEWSHDGSEVISVRGNQSGSSSIDRRPASLQEAPQALVDLPGWDDNPVWGANNRIYWENEQQGLVSANPDGTDVTSIAYYGKHVDVSTDGTKLVYFDASSNNVMVSDADGTNKRVLLSAQSVPALTYYDHFAWSPDDSQIVMELRTEHPVGRATHDIVVVNADGSNLRNLTNNTVRFPDGDFAPDWGPSPQQ